MSLSKIRSANEAWNSPAWYVSLCTRSIGTSKKGTQKQRGIEEETYYTKSSPFLTTKRLHGNKSQKELHSTWQKVLKEKVTKKMRTAIRTKNFFMQTIKHANVDQTFACLKSTKPQLLLFFHESRVRFRMRKSSKKRALKLKNTTWFPILWLSSLQKRLACLFFSDILLATGLDVSWSFWKLDHRGAKSDQT